MKENDKCLAVLEIIYIVYWCTDFISRIKLDEYTLCFCPFDLGLKGCLIILKKFNLIDDTHLILL